MSATSSLHEKFLKEHNNYKKLLEQYTKVPSREKRHLRRRITLVERSVQELFQKLIQFNISSRTKYANTNKLKLLPHSAVQSVRKLGKKSAYLKDTADVARMRLVARSSRIIGAEQLSSTDYWRPIILNKLMNRVAIQLP